MTGDVEVTLTGTSAGIASRSYATVLGQVTRSLEEVDRIIDPDRRDRIWWNVTGTRWAENSKATVILSPVTKSKARDATAELRRPGQVYWGGLLSLAQQPEIPPAFSASVVNRVLNVGRQIETPSSGLEAVTIRPLEGARDPASFDAMVETNASRAIEAKSLAYGSLVGTLDLISARGGSRKIGLRVDHGSPVMCDVQQLDKDLVMAAFEKRVLVIGLLKRNARGQAISMHVDDIERIKDEPRLSVAQIVGAIPDLGGEMTSVEYIRSRRGDH